MMTSPTSSKRISHKDALLRLLSDGREHTMQELLRVGGFRYGGRLHELRKDGHLIETVRKGEDVYAYRLILDGKQGVLI